MSAANRRQSVMIKNRPKDDDDAPEVEAENVRVFIRVRPFNAKEIEEGTGGAGRLRSVVSCDGVRVAVLDHDNGYVEKDAMTFTGTFWSIPAEQTKGTSKQPFASQEIVYAEAGEPLVVGAFDGYNSSIFAYGQTGSGKTYSMMGYDEDRGIIPRLCESILARIASDGKIFAHRKYELKITFFEIYNEKVRCLLGKSGTSDNFEGLKVRNHPVTGPFVEGLTTKEVNTVADFVKWMNKGTANRTVKSTSMNDVSSRSHAIFKVELVQSEVAEDDDGEVPLVRRSQINIVDLAGSERIRKSKVQGDKLTEATHINQSLSTLRKVIDALIDVAKGKKTMPPYRESLLTWLLSESLGGSSRTVMIAAVSPHFSNAEESHSTLRYAQKAKSIVNNVRMTENKSDRIIREMKEQMAKMQQMVEEGRTNPEAAVVDGATQARLREEIEERQKAIYEYEHKNKEILDKHSELKEELEEKERMLDVAAQERMELLQSKGKVEELAEEVQSRLKQEKQRAFQNAFRMAFRIGQSKQSHKEKVSKMRAEMQEMTAQVEAAKSAMAAAEKERLRYSMENDKVEYDNRKLQQQVKRLRAQLSTAHIEHQQYLHDAKQTVNQREQLLQEVARVVNGKNSEMHDLHVKLLKLENKYDDLLAECDQKSQELSTLKRQRDEEMSTLRTTCDQDIAAVRRTLQQRETQLSSVTAQLDDADSERKRQQSKCKQLQQQITDMQQQLEKERATHASELRKEREKHKTVVERCFVERETYAAMVREGEQLVTELQNMAALQMDTSATTYRAGKAGVRAWLQSLGLERLQQGFEAQGFDTMEAVLGIKEDDLLPFQLLPGHRRKILISVQERKAQYMAAKINQTDLKKEFVTQRELLANLNAWLGDFHDAVTADLDFGNE